MPAGSRSGFTNTRPGDPDDQSRYVDRCGSFEYNREAEHLDRHRPAQGLVRATLRRQIDADRVVMWAGQDLRDSAKRLRRTIS